MMCFKPVLVVFLFSCILLFHHHFIVPVKSGNKQALAPYYTGDIAINCGSIGNSTAFDGREWLGESGSKFMSGESTSSTVVEKSFLDADPVPYMTSRISASSFHFTFQLNPGPKFIRLHFYPASYLGFEKSMDFFSVKSGPFTLLRDFSPTLTCDYLGIKYLVKEFCLNVEEHGKLSITFSPSQSSKSKNHIVHAFVNGIEITSMPTSLYYTPDGDLGVPIVGQKFRFYGIDNSTALEMVQRLNIGGSFISSVEDFGMFRRWTADADYLLESGVSRVNHMTTKIEYTNLAVIIAPPKVYQTSWKTARAIGVHQLYSLTWKIPMNIGFGYLVRLHFCNFDTAMADSAREFSILINNQTAEARADVIRWSSRPGIPVYKDYVVMMKGDKKGSKCHLMIELRSLNGLVLGLLKGLEIFKLSDFENSLATPNPASPKRVPTTWNLKIQRLISFFSQSNVIGTSMTFIIICVNATVYNLRKFWEENFQDEKQERSASVEPSCHSFSLAEIKLATQNFSDALVIGRGGFGKVYKGCIRRVPEIVAIKRLNFFSRQGAREFWTEIETLSKLRHIHLVSLIGYCNEHNEMILVYEYISGGTLADNIYRFARKGRDCAPLSWEQRLKICIGAARGLDYLHTGSEYGIIHRDVKDSNILLDENFVAKISDFGLSKLEKLTQSKSYVSTKIKGTVGYLDPDYCMTRRLTRNADVYAFGIILLVVLSGRPALDTTNPGESESLLACFQECIPKGEFDRIVDPNIYTKMSPKSLQEFVKSVENCLQRQPKNRPAMAQLVGSLEQVLQLQERPVISASENVSIAVQHDKAETIQQFKISQSSVATIPEERVISPPREEITRTNALPRGKKSSFWVWPWKKIQIPARGVTAAKSSDSTDDEIAPYLQDHVRKFLGGGVDKIVQFSYEELATATCDFSLANRIIGEGSPDTVYFSELRGEKVAIRKMGTERRKEFLVELRVLAHVHHRNLLRLIGYCVERSLFLVYEYVDNGNLNLHLRASGGEPLSWSTRVQIALDSARALEYIHEYTVPAYVHRNISSSAILIDKNFQAKVAHFYFTKCSDDGGSSICTRLVGSFGYLPPEYVVYGDVSPKVDVYAFGVVLRELISAKEAIVKGASIADSKGLVGLFEEVLSLPDPNDDLRKMVDPRLGDSYPFQSVREMAQLARACTHENPQLRPGMRAIVVALLTLSSAPNDSDIGRS